MKVLFYVVTQPQQKKECICFLAHDGVMKGNNMQFIVEDDAAAKFLDQLLWTFPPESFLPHVVKKLPKQEKIAIFTKDDPKWEKAAVTFNLRSAPIENAKEVVIEILDKTDPSKEALSNSKLEHYQKEGKAISIFEWTDARNNLD